jgi:hypothetical protein
LLDAPADVLFQAEDLGLNRAADQWKYDGHDLFTPDEKQLRKQVWWGCFTADVSVLLRIRLARADGIHLALCRFI